MFSKTCGYAFRAILFVAIHSSEQNKIGIKAIAKELDLPLHFLGKILQKLVRKKVLLSVKGPGGGFYININMLDISALKIIEIIDGLDVFTKCGLGLSECSDNHPCPVHIESKPYRDNMHQLLARKTIREIIKEIIAGKTFVKSTVN